MIHDLPMIERVYARTPGRVRVARRLVGRPLTLTEKILYAHYWRAPKAPAVRGNSYVDFAPDRVAMQDATAQMALLQFMSAGIPSVAVPSTVHCDHLITAQTGAEADLDVDRHRPVAVLVGVVAGDVVVDAAVGAGVDPAARELQGPAGARGAYLLDGAAGARDPDEQRARVAHEAAQDGDDLALFSGANGTPSSAQASNAEGEIIG